METDKVLDVFLRVKRMASDPKHIAHQVRVEALCDELDHLPRSMLLFLLAEFTLLMIDLERGKETPRWVVERIRKSRGEQAKDAGAKGGQARVDKFDPLKKWAIAENKKLTRGSARERARKLMKAVPLDLAEISKDPERLIRETIEAHERAKLASRSA